MDEKPGFVSRFPDGGSLESRALSVTALSTDIGNVEYRPLPAAAVARPAYSTAAEAA